MDVLSQSNETTERAGAISEGQMLLKTFTTSLVCLVTAFACLMIADFMRLPNLADFCQTSEFSWQMAGLGLLLTPVCIALSLAIKLFQLKFIGYDPNYSGEFKLSTIGCIVSALLSGFGEEVLFRGVLQPILGIWVSSLAFALMHIDSREDCPYAFYTFVYGLVFGVLFQITGSLWVPIIVHVLNNYLASNPPRCYEQFIARVWRRALDS